MHRRKKKATDETAGVQLPTKRRRQGLINYMSYYNVIRILGMQ